MTCLLSDQLVDKNKSLDKSNYDKDPFFEAKGINFHLIESNMTKYFHCDKDQFETVLTNSKVNCKNFLLALLITTKHKLLTNYITML